MKCWSFNMGYTVHLLSFPSISYPSFSKGIQSHKTCCLIWWVYTEDFFSMCDFFHYHNGLSLSSVLAFESPPCHSCLPLTIQVTVNDDPHEWPSGNKTPYAAGLPPLTSAVSNVLDETGGRSARLTYLPYLHSTDAPTPTIGTLSQCGVEINPWSPL